MIAFDELQIGSLVRLASGSIKLVVTGKDDRSDQVSLIGWADRAGVVRLVLDPACLVWPRPAEPTFPPLDAAE